MRKALILLVLLCVPAFGQKHENQAKGFAADKVYQFGDVDHINLFNGNVNAVIPIGESYPVSSALSYRFALVYGGNSWDYYSNSYNNTPGIEPQTFDLPYTSPVVDTNAGFGWHLSFAGRLQASKSCSGCMMFVSPDGATHNFGPTLHRGSGESVQANVSYTNDATYYRMRSVNEEVIGPGGVPRIENYYDVESPDGTVYRFKRINLNLEHVRDPFGNKVTVTYGSMPDGAPLWTIFDGHRTHRVEFIRREIVGKVDADPKTFTLVKRLRLAAVNGQEAVYTFEYAGADDAPVSASRLFAAGQDCNVGPEVIVPILRAVQLADGSSWQIQTDIGYAKETVKGKEWTYSRPAGDLIGANAPCPATLKHPAYEARLTFSGTMLGLTLPTLGRIEWGYKEWNFPPVDPGGVCPDAPSGVNICSAALSQSVGVTRRTEKTRGGATISQRTYENRWLLDPIATEIVTVKTLTGTTFAQTFSTSRHYFALSSGPSRGQYGLPYTPYSATQTNADFPVPTTDPVATGGTRKLSQILYDANGEIVRYSYVGYEGDDAPMTYGQESNRRQQSERTVYRMPGATTDLHYTLTTNADFDGVGHYRVTTADGNAAGGGARTTTTNFNRIDGDVDNAGRDTGTYPSAFTLPSTAESWILNTWSSREVSEAGSGSPAARTLAWFDPATGFLRRTRTIAGTARGANDLVAEYTHTNGNVTREDYFGGDLLPEEPSWNGLSVTEPLAAMTLAPRRYRITHDYAYGVRKSSSYADASGTALSFKTLDLDIDSNTGMPLTSRDPAGQATTFTFDVAGRFLSMTPPGIAATSYAYENAAGTMPARVTITRGDTVQVAQFDDLGRVWREIGRMPPLAGTATPYLTMRETTYTPMGWKATVSETEQITPATNDATASHAAFTPVHKTSWSYDAFGRPTSVTAPDATSTSFTYLGMLEAKRSVKIATALNAVTDVDTWERYDRHGRLREVEEPSGPNNANVQTAYGYDAGGRLVSATTTSAGVTQQRLFTYDNRGFLLAERHPEKGVAGNGWTTYGAYDARGNARSKIDGAPGGLFDLRMTYDAAERLTKIEELIPNTTSRRVVKELAFGTSGSANGKLLSASRHHDDPVFGGRVTVTESYQYNGLGGRPSLRTTTVAGTATIPSRTFTQEQSYDPSHGGVQSVRYPNCAGCGGSTDTVTYGYQNGLLRQVANYATFEYHPNGLIARVAHANGATDTWVADGSGMPRPFSITATDANGGLLWMSGAYQYDAAGNISKIGEQSYVYDGASRLAEEPRANGRLLYRYDAFGNLLGQWNEGWYGDAFSRTVQDYDVDSGTNRMRSTGPMNASYDEAGNLTAWANGTRLPRMSFVASWDSVGSMRSLATFDSPVPPVTPALQNEQHFLYTADGERIAIVDFDGAGLRRSTKWTLRGFDNQLLRTYVDDATTGWSWVDDNIHGGGKLLGNVSNTAGSRQYSVDHLGSPRVLTNSGGLLFGEQAFKAFGTGGATGGGALQFTSHERDWMPNGDNLDYMHARYYVGAMGRFLSVDPTWSSADLGNPQSWNRYAYVLNNPLNRTDPDGKCPICVLVVGGIIGGMFLSGDVANAPAPGDTIYANAGPASAIGGSMKGVAIGAMIRGAFGIGAEGGSTGDRATNDRAREVADGEQAQGRRGGTAGSLRTLDGKTYNDTSGPDKQHHPEVQKALDNVPQNQRSAFHGNCAEPGCVSKALNDGSDPRGGDMQTAKIRGPNSPNHGAPHEACSTCKAILDFFGIKY